MAHIIIVSNPFEPFKSESHTVVQPITIREWLLSHYGPEFVEFTKPTLCTVNGAPIIRRYWDTTILRERDIVNFTTLAGDLVTAGWILVGLIIGTAVSIAFQPKIDTSPHQEQQQGDPVYTLKGQRNQIRLNDPIPSYYGKNRIFPDYAAMPYTSYKDNDQYLYQLFCVGQGKYAIHSMNIEDTLLENFDDIEVEVIQPGEEVTLFPDNVVTSEEVEGIELKAPNEPGSGAVWIEDSPGDPLAEPPIEATGHYAQAGYAGPFVANPANTETTKLEVDVALPRGLFLTNNEGGLDSLTVTILFEYRQIDNAGTPIGDWTTLTTFTKTLATNTPQRFTAEAEVPSGRYEVRASRTDTKNTNARAGHTAQWEGMRALLPSTRTYGNVTLIALKARATNNLNDSSSTRFNIWATRKLAQWQEDSTGENGVWTEELETRSIAWAAADVLRAAYGGRLQDQFIDLETLVGLDLIYFDRQEFFDWGFDNQMTVWDALKIVSRVGRAVPILNGSLVTVVRDSVKLLPTAVFNQENIVARSFDWSLEFPAVDEYNGLEVTYTDPDTGMPEVVICKLSDEAGDNLERIRLEGCADRAQAYHWGMYIRNKRRFGREPIGLKTGMEGHIPSFGDQILVSHDSVKYGKGGLIRSVLPDSSGNWLLELSEPIQFDTGVAVYRIYIRGRDGAPYGNSPYQAYKTVDTSDNQVIIIDAVNDLSADLKFDRIHELPLYNIGPENEEGRLLTITHLGPGEDDTVEVQAINYDERYFSGDDFDPPEKGETEGKLQDRTARPAVKAVLVTRSENVANEIVVSWRPARAALYYIVELSYDGKIWSRKGDNIESTSFVLQVLPKFIYVRVAAVNEDRGPWAYWVGEAPVENIIECAPPTSLGVTVGSTVNFLQTDGTVVPRMKATWTAPQDQLVLSKGLIRVQFKLQAAPTWEEWSTVPGTQVFEYITDLQIGQSYVVRIRSENQHGGESDWVESSAATVLGDTQAPPALSAPTVTAYPGYNRVQWSKSTADDIAEYRIYRNTDSSTSGGNFILLGEQDGLEWDDPTAIPGVTYWYFVLPVDGSENPPLGNISNISSGTSVVTSEEPINDPIPSDPTAAEKPSPTADGFYQAGDGTIFAYMTIRLPGLPANARWQNLLYRKQGSTEWMIAGQYKNTITTTAVNDPRVDDITPGVAYEFATQSWNGRGGSNIVSVTGSPFTATHTGIPANPSSFVGHLPDDDIDSVPAKFYNVFGQQIQLQGSRVTFTPSTSKDVLYYEWFSWGANLSGTPVAPDPTQVGQWTSDAKLAYFDYYTSLPGSAQYLWVRAYNRTGNRAAWEYTGLNMNAYAGVAGGTLSSQDADAIAVTGGSLTGLTTVESAEFATTSARRHKKHIRTIKGGLKKVQKLRGVSFKWKHHRDGIQDIGFIAEEVQKVLPSIVMTDGLGKVESVDYAKTCAVLVEAVKELAREVEKLKRKLRTKKRSNK